MDAASGRVGRAVRMPYSCRPMSPECRSSVATLDDMSPCREHAYGCLKTHFWYLDELQAARLIALF